MTGQRLEQAIIAADRDSIEGPACPRKAAKTPESANVLASDVEWVAERNKARQEAMADHRRRPGWSYLAEVESRQ